MIVPNKDLNKKNEGKDFFSKYDQIRTFLHFLCKEFYNVYSTSAEKIQSA